MSIETNTSEQFHRKIESGLQSALNQCTALYDSLQSVTIPDTVHIQFSFLLKMSTTMFETCRGV